MLSSRQFDKASIYRETTTVKSLDLSSLLLYPRSSLVDISALAARVYSVSHVCFKLRAAEW